MASTIQKSKPTYGFLTVVEHPQLGLCGGYLVLNPAGRPLEFHCTAPIKPNRAQEILYGRTLHDFLYGEQIGGALIGNNDERPLLVFTDLKPVLAARRHVSMPLVMVLGDSATEAGDLPDGSADGDNPRSNKTYRVDAAGESIPRPALLRHGRNRLALSAADEADRPLVVDCLTGLDESFDLSEPFERIRAAIEEARQAAQ